MERSAKEEVPMDEMTEDGKKVLLRNHLQLVTHCLKEEQGNSEVSSDQRNKMAEGRNNATSCEGTSEVVEQHLVVCSLAGLVKNPGAIELCKKNGYPSPQLLKFMREILRKVFKLHDKGEAHGHLCPESILISKERSEEQRQKELFYCAKLRPDSPCLNSSKTGCDVSVWQAPEQRTKDPGRPTLSANIYSLGEIFYYCITGMPSKSKGWETVRKKRDLPLVNCPEAKDLILWSQEEKPELRPKANELLNHPLFWTSEKRVSFLRDIIERPSYSKYSNLWNDLQKLSLDSVTGGEWHEKIYDENVLNYILEQQRKPEEEKMHEQNEKSEQKKNSDSKQNEKEACMYNFRSVRDLVRLIRNMRVRYGELPEDVQRSVGTLHKGFDSFFTSRFPNLLIEVYKVVRKFCCDVSVWQAPEQRTKNPGRLTLSANIYSLGAIFYYCITGPPSKLDGWEIVPTKGDLPLVACPVAKDLILRSQMKDPGSRSKANELLKHPLFWEPEKRVSFLRDIIERPSDSKYSNLWNELQKLSVHTVTGGKWDEKINDDNVRNYILEQKSNHEEACNL